MHVVDNIRQLVNIESMSSGIRDLHVQFAQIAVRQRFSTPENVRAALELQRRYEAAGVEMPSLPRILVQKGWLDLGRAERILRHMLKGEALPDAAPPPKRATPGGGVDVSEFEIMDDLGLEPPASGIDFQAASAMKNAVEDDREAWIRGMGATVVRKNLVKGYEITQVMGEGSMGIVYCAHQISMDRTVALKVLPPEKTKDQRFVESFLAEARNAGRLNHPNLIRVHEVGKSGDVYYYSMEYVEGQRVDEWMDECENGRLEPRQAIPVFTQVCAALDYGYRSGVIHREIRLNSIMVNDDGQAKLSDLGLVKDEQTRFLDGENAYYVAPEQVTGENVDTRTDIYCLGCCLFQCLTGEPPFEGGSPKEVLHRRVVAPVPDPRQFNAAVPPELSRTVMKMMARRPEDRFQTPAEVADALKKAPLAAPPGGVKKPMGMMARRPLKPASGRFPKPGSGRVLKPRRRR
jgi:predicted Ser/Thr protein kinase